MSHGDLPDTCKFGHIFETYDESVNTKADRELIKKIKKGEIEDLQDLKDEDGSIGDLLEEWKRIKVSSKSQGTAFAAVFTAVDELDTGKDYNSQKLDESVHISPQSNMHAEFMQRKQQAEQNIKQTMQSYQQLIKQKHMLEHDIRKLRSRVEAFDSKDETLLKGDFIELVDGAGQSPRQGGDQMSIKAYRDNNIYPSIVADFNEMESAEDLMDAETKAEKKGGDPEDYEDGTLANVPSNEKAILRKKWKMYEQWKDLYGSEVSRKLNELKSQLKSAERSIEETKEWLKPYVRDAAMINKMGENQDKHGAYPSVRGNSTMIRTLDWLIWKPMKLEHGELQYATDDDDEPTHYRVIFVKGVHVNIASFSQPQSPADGPSAGKVWWCPGFVCKHVFENIFKKKADEHQKMVENVMEDYVGDFEPSDDSKKLKEARQEAEMSVRELREEIQDGMDENVPIELSAKIRRAEDGLDPIDEAIEKKYLEKIDEILADQLDEGFTEESDKDSQMYSSFQKTYKEFFGRTDPFYMKNPGDGLEGLTNDLRYEYYWGLKIGLGLYTMK